MKKVTILSLIALTLFSCTKEAIRTNDPQQQDVFHKNSQKSSSLTVLTEPYSGNYFDSCRNENVVLTGSVTYTTQERFVNSGLYLSYSIDLTASGVGATTGTVFYGGINQTAVVKENNDKYRAKLDFEVKFTSANGQELNFSETAKLIAINGQTKLFFDNIVNNCK